MRRPLLLLLAALPALAPAARPEDRGSGAVVRHVLDVTLHPVEGRLTGTDELTLPPGRRTATVRLHPDLEVTATCGDRPARLRAADEPGTFRVTAGPSCRNEDGSATITFALDGRIADPPTDEPSLHFVTGDRTTGIISEEGAFLAGGTGWYADTGDMAHFTARVTVPDGWSVVSQGDATGPVAAEGGGRTFTHDSGATPFDGLALSAGPYVSSSVEHGGVRISTWFLPGDEALAPQFLEAAAAELDRLVGLLGPYPGTKFDIVENFFTTGYGFPTYTLLGRDVIRMGPRALRPGYLDHELAHAWLGNHVFVDLDGGNWCEGLTTYVTNYLNTAKAGEEEALAARRRVSQRYSVDVPGAKDFSPAAFREKTDDAGGSVGYGKVSMVFHLLNRELGDDAFWAGIRRFVDENAGRRASWDDVRRALESASGRDLGTFFAEWIGRPGLPKLALQDVRQEEGAVAGVVAQADGVAWTLRRLDLEVETVDGRVTTHAIDVTGTRTPFRLPVEGRARRVTLDPGFHVPRRIEPQDLPAGLARTLASEDLLVVTPNPPPGDPDEAWLERERTISALAAMAAGDRGRVLMSRDAADAEVRAASVLLLGDASDNGWIREMAERIATETGVDVRAPNAFRAGDRRWRGSDASVLVSIPHPHLPGATVTAWVPNWQDALDDGRMIFHYGWDTWVAIEEGRARDRGTIWPERSATSVVLAEAEAPGEAGARLLATVAGLTDPRYEGRAAGQGAVEAGRFLFEHMSGFGIEPFGEAGSWTTTFTFDVRDVPGKPALRLDGQPRRVLPVVPATEWLPSGTREEAAAAAGVSGSPGRIPFVLRLPRGVVSAGGPRPDFRGLDFADAAALVVDDGSPGLRDRVVTWMDEARVRNAKALIVLRPDAEWPGEPDLVLAGSLRVRSQRPQWLKAWEELGLAASLRQAQADRARLPPLARNADFPLFFAGRELAEALRAEGGVARGSRSFAAETTDLALSFTLRRVEDFNVVGRIPGRLGATHGVLLSAHHDGLGEDAEGRFLEGAADNAAGAAVVLEVARRLASDPPQLPVVVAFLSGEEWGLQGSRALAARWSETGLRLDAVVNVDSVGHAGKPLHVVGRSREPKLAAILEEEAKAAGLEVGPDIDRHADRDGSDHWPWVEHGVPAVDLFQADYGVINTGADTSEKLDAATLARIADAVERAVRRLATP